MRILYHNWGTVTSAIVVSHEVDRQECAEFCDQFKQYVEANLLGKRDNNGYEAPGMNTSEESSLISNGELYKPF